MRGLSLPISITVKNTGTTTLNSISVDIGGQTKTFAGQNLLPGGSTVLTVGYEVPQTVADAPYTVSSGAASDTGTITLNCPDVGIKSVKLIGEENVKRTVEVTLENSSDIPLSGSGKTVKLAFYKDSGYKTMIGSEIPVSSGEYANIDLGICTVRQELNVSSLLNPGAEIPAGGIKVYVKAWVVDTHEPYTLNNTDMITLRSLLRMWRAPITSQRQSSGRRTTA